MESSLKAAELQVKSLSKKRTIGMIAVVLAFVLCIGHVFATMRKNAIYGIDFRSVYSSTRCLIVGCNPYSSSETMVQFLKQGGTVEETGPPPKLGAFVPHFPGYPPSTLFYYVPLALLSWPAAWIAYMAIASSLYFVTVLLFARVCSDYTPIATNLMLAVFVGLQGSVFMPAQPVLVASSLCCIATLCLLKNRFPKLSVFCFAFSLTLKPHLGFFVLLYFFLASAQYRKRAWQISVTAFLMCLPGLLWASILPATHNWLQDYGTNIRMISSRGNLSDPGPTNFFASRIVDLQTITSLIHNDPSFYNPAAWGISLLLLAFWIYAVIRTKPSKEKDLICIAAIAIFSLLPIYHRDYDTRLLLVTFPALSLLWENARRWGRVGMVLTGYLSVAASDYYMFHSHANSSWVRWAHNNYFWVFLLERPVPLSCMLLVMFYLGFLYRPSGHTKMLTSDHAMSGAPYRSHTG